MVDGSPGYFHRPEILGRWCAGKYTFFSSGLAEVRVALSRYGVIMEEKEGQIRQR